MRKQEKLLQKQNQLLERLINYLDPPIPVPEEDPDLLYADEEEEAVAEMREELRRRGYKTVEKG